MQQLGRELAVPPVLPRHESDGRCHRLPSRLVLLENAQDTREGLGAETCGEAGAVCLNGFVCVLQAFGKGTQNLPFFGGFPVLHALGAVLSHLRAPDGVDAQVLVEDHE